MEQRPSDSQDESANELPQSAPQPPTVADQPATTERTEEISLANQVPNEPIPDDPIITQSVVSEQGAGDAPDQPLIDQSQKNQSNRDRGRQERPGHERPGHERAEKQRDGQPRQNQSGQPGNQGAKQEKSGQDRQREANNARQQNNQTRQQNQPNNDRPGQERPNQERPNQDRPARNNQPGHERPGHERPGQDRPGSEKQPRDAKPERDMMFDDGDDEIRNPDTRQPDRVLNGPRDATVRESDDRLMIGITLGDYNGIGPEVILKALQHNRLQKICTPVIYGSMRVLNRYRNLLELKDWNLNGIQQVEQASHKLTNVITCWPDQNQEIQPGKVTPEAGQAAFACLQRAVEDLRDGKLDAIVTAPINKHNIQSEEFKFPGHTEYLAEAFSVSDNLMFLVSERLRVGVVTGHVPLGKVRQNITRERVLQKLTMMSRSLRLDFGIDKPRIAVLGLNPHAGEEGLLGNEEQEILKPLIKQLQDKGNLVYGPFPADGFFGTRAYLKFDAVLAMYHDQGLIPFKAIAFDEGVNFTAAMPVVRTSPDHGTAYDIAGKNLADETSMVQAIYTACDIARRRRETAEIDAGALKPRRERAV